jgi:hypothetical protein
MQDLYTILLDPSPGNLKRQSIGYFNDLIKEYPTSCMRIITYINECFNYKSPLLTEEKDWGMFLRERFRANNIPEELRSGLIDYESKSIVTAIDAFLTHQKEPQFQTLIAKQNLRLSMLATIQKADASIGDKQKANELITSLDAEINQIYERMRQEQKKLGNYKGYDSVQAAKSKLKINISTFIN